MTAAEIDAYLAGIEEPKRSTLVEVGRRILNVIPEAEQTISYHMPAFKVHGKVVAGFAAFKHHLAYLPHSGSVFEEMAEDLTAYTYSKGSLRFPVDEPLPQKVIKRLIEIRIHQAGL